MGCVDGRQRSIRRAVKLPTPSKAHASASFVIGKGNSLTDRMARFTPHLLQGHVTFKEQHHGQVPHVRAQQAVGGKFSTFCLVGSTRTRVDLKCVAKVLGRVWNVFSKLSIFGLLKLPVFVVVYSHSVHCTQLKQPPILLVWNEIPKFWIHTLRVGFQPHPYFYPKIDLYSLQFYPGICPEITHIRVGCGMSYLPRVGRLVLSTKDTIEGFRCYGMIKR